MWCWTASRFSAGLQQRHSGSFEFAYPLLKPLSPPSVLPMDGTWGREQYQGDHLLGTSPATRICSLINKRA